jgi:hypothetical protein
MSLHIELVKGCYFFYSCRTRKKDYLCKKTDLGENDNIPKMEEKQV